MNSLQEDLVKNNRRLAYYISQKWNKKLLGKINFEDLLSDCLLALVKAALTYKLDKGTKFNTYAVRCMDNEVLMRLRKHKKKELKINISALNAIDTNTGDDHNIWELIQKNYTDSDNINAWINEKAITDALTTLNRRDKEILDMKINGLTQDKIGDITGFSQSYISRINKNIRSKLIRELKKAQ